MSNFLYRMGLVAAIGACSSLNAYAVDSYTFSEVIKSGSGVGDINLLAPKSPTTPPNLNDHIKTYNSWGGIGISKQAISFGVDINEASSGTEKAETQAVTVQYAWLEVKDGLGTRNFGAAPAGTPVVSGSGFYTETKATVAAKGSTVRNTYYTLLGRSGSAQITGANSITGQFDSTLKIVLPTGTSFNGVTTAVLHIRLLDTNANLGDPEAFYDISGGFEDVALLNEADSIFLDSNATILAPRVISPIVELSTEGQASSVYYNSDSDPNTNVPSTGFNSLYWIQKPGAGQYNLVAYEDLHPNQGDYDFNDALVAYNYALGVNSQGKVEQISGTAFLLARGSTYTHDWVLRLPAGNLSGNVIGTNACTVARSLDQKAPGTVSASGCTLTNTSTGIEWKAFPDTVTLFPASDVGGTAAANPINATGTMIRGPKATMTMTLSNPVLLKNFSADDPYLTVKRSNGTTTDIHLSSKDNLNFPFAMIMPTQWKWPREGVAIGDAYPSFLNFVSSRGTSSVQWYNTPDASKVVPGSGQANWTVDKWSW